MTESKNLLALSMNKLRVIRWIALVAGIAVVIGALHAKPEARSGGQQAWDHGAVIKTSRQGVYSASVVQIVR